MDSLTLLVGWLHYTMSFNTQYTNFLLHSHHPCSLVLLQYETLAQTKYKTVLLKKVLSISMSSIIKKDNVL